jgi:type I protein arginine methyltransferase
MTPGRSIRRRLADPIVSILRRSRTARRIAAAVAYDDENRAVFSSLDWHEKMLADHTRMTAYEAGLAGSIAASDVVVDVGTGTGALALMAERAGARRVIAIDHSDIVDLASEIARHNGSKIEFVRSHSRDFVADEPVDVIVHEQMGHTIFGENLLENLLDLKRRVLRPGGRIVPAEFTLFAAPFSLRDDQRWPFLWELSRPGVDLSFLRPRLVDAPETTERSQRFLRNVVVDRVLAAGHPVIDVDLDALDPDTGEAVLRTQHELRFQIDEDGVMDGLGWWFSTRFPNGVTFDTAPTSRQTNWENLLMRTERLELHRGDVVSCTVDLQPLRTPRQWRLSSVEVQR